MNRKLNLIVPMLVLVTALFSSQSSAMYSNVYFLGDSLMDNGSPISPGMPFNFGNNPTPPYASGRFSNGNTWVESFASELGFSALWGVNNFAVGGAQSGDLTSVVTVQQGSTGNSQTGNLLASLGGSADPNALYVIGIGGNDNIANLSAMPPLDPVALTNQILDNIDLGIDTLETAGANHFLLINSTDVSISPIFPAEGRAGVIGFNTALDARFGGDHMIFDSFAYFESVRGSYLDENGILGVEVGENALVCLAVPACAALAPGGDTSDYLLFDSVHPTKEFHAAFGQAVAAAVVPLPAPIALLIVGLAGLRLFAARRRG